LGLKVYLDNARNGREHAKDKKNWQHNHHNLSENLLEFVLVGKVGHGQISQVGVSERFHESSLECMLNVKSA
jgi:hypothetical protein